MQTTFASTIFSRHKIGHVLVALGMLLAHPTVAAAQVPVPPETSRTRDDETSPQERQEEAAWRVVLEKEAPAALADWDLGNSLRNKPGSEDAAAAAYRKVTELAPTFDHAHRRLCWSERDRGAAIASCRKAVELKERWENHLALATRLRETPDGKSEASAELAAAYSAAPKERRVLVFKCISALDEENYELFIHGFDELNSVDPKGSVTQNLGVVRLLLDGNTDGAVRKLATLEEEGIATEVTRKIVANALKVEAEEWTPLRIAKWFFGALAGWFGLLGVLYLVGERLSKITLNKTVELNQTSIGDGVQETSSLKRVYSAVISASGVLYFLSLPFVGVVVVTLVCGLIYAAFAVGQIPIKLLLFLVVMAGSSLWAIAKAVYYSIAPDKSPDPGILLSRADQPRIYSLLDDVAKRCDTRPVDKLFLTQGTDFAVYEDGAFLQTSRGAGVRCMVVGAGLLRGVGAVEGMRLGALRSVLAHEYGHFRNADTSGGAFALATRRSMTTLLRQLIAHGAASAVNPAWHFARGYFLLFLRVSQGASRLQEVLADRWAISVYGTRNFVQGFSQVVSTSVRFDSFLTASVNEALREKAIVPNLYAFQPASLAELDSADAEKKSFEEPAGPYDSHPSPADRLAAARALDVHVSAEPDDELPAWSLIDRAESLEQQLTFRIAEALYENHEVVLHTRPVKL